MIYKKFKGMWNVFFLWNLIVEDEEMIREGSAIIWQIVVKWKSLSAVDGQQLLEKSFQLWSSPSTTDIQLPKLNGLEVPAEIRKTSQVPVLMLTAFRRRTRKMKVLA